MEACVSPACRRLLPKKWEASPVARQRLGREAVTKDCVSYRSPWFAALGCVCLPALSLATLGMDVLALLLKPVPALFAESGFAEGSR